MLEIKALEKKYKNKKILNDISFNADYGEITQIIGENGSGKTTIFKIICNLLRPDSGTVTLDNHKITNRDVGYLCEERSLYLDCSIMQQAQLVLKLNGISANEADLSQWLNYLKLNEFKTNRLSTLSKGNKQKAALLLCLIKDPKIIILDEPYTALDRDNVCLLNNIMKKLKGQGKIVLFSSHQHIEDCLCDHYLILKNGEIESDIKKEWLLNNGDKMVRFNISDNSILPEKILIETKEYNGKENVHCKSITTAKRLASELLKYEEVNNCMVDSLQISDLLEENKWQN